MTGADCARASSTCCVMSPILERGSAPVLRTFSATLFANTMMCCDHVVAGKTMNRQQIGHNRGVLSTLSFMSQVSNNYTPNIPLLG